LEIGCEVIGCQLQQISEFHIKPKAPSTHSRNLMMDLFFCASLLLLTHPKLMQIFFLELDKLA
jgi:hypothetical protein